QSFSNSRWTYYDITVGTTACGGRYANSDFAVALNSAQYSPSQCGRQINLSYGGKTARATIVDNCPGCPYGGLDLTEGLFEYFAPLPTGVIYGTWSYA
ncbi:RlpA-like double-psi beta-barrel-protein domain-containing protein-containing protein, partial [Vararia minispora EC-137]